MKIIPAKTPGFVKTLFPNFVWSINTDKKELYLTFDDGPTPEITDWVLHVLAEYNAKATFFCIGKNIESNVDIFQNILSQGHAVGNHTYDHLKGWKSKTKGYVGNTELTDSVITFQIQNSHFAESYDLNSSKLFRPPYGKFKTKQSKKLQELGYKIILWDVLSYDWDKSVSEEQCLSNVISAAKEGSIIVFHDSVKASKNLKYTLPKILEYYKKKGYVFMTLA
ncbi:polysaccharide deacetylase family protein [Winogradskyella flava]|uniref:Polysaccharide deacetylase family protein n=1 Tax=Winogradskyella flava TaxID=1884876 RepID=A0A842ILD8_9FLAO|nr:polysaccharide deacetylase family protein [Winogradskyella flava]MBC2843521.1 polysaccharide deacetylase family protein [Winogradskyella flava]